MTTLQPTTTLALETAVNTSASPTFKPWPPYANATPANVSRIGIRQAFPQLKQRPIIWHVMPWWGLGSHPDIGYTSSDIAQIRKQRDDMVIRANGLNNIAPGPVAVQIDDYGAKSALCVQNWLIAALEIPNFFVQIIKDKGIYDACPPGMSVTDHIIALAKGDFAGYMQHPRYLRSASGRPIYGFFEGAEKVPIDWAAIKAAVDPSIILMRENGNGAEGEFEWGLSTANLPAKPASGCIYFEATAGKGFNDTSATKPGFGCWPPGTEPARVQSQQDGDLWMAKQAGAVAVLVATSIEGALLLGTWNDYEESTEVETGIKTSLGITLTLTGSVLSWTATGNLKTGFSADLFVSEDGEGYTKFAGSSLSGSQDIAVLPLAPGTYTFFAKVNGQPCVVNAVSANVSYTIAIPAPPPPPPPPPTVVRGEIWVDGSKLGNLTIGDHDTTLVRVFSDGSLAKTDAKFTV